ncbi:MAG TPA: lyase [Burkholderiales bacterium]|nr:lyase [Burkholderiales bacterium]
MLKPAFFAALLALPAAASAEVSIQEYPIPGSLYAHDVWADPRPGGPVYFSAQRGGQLGILDPKTGKMETVSLAQGLSPHGVIAASDGAVWLTDGGQNAIARVDPKTRAVKLWPLPEDRGYANLNTAAFDGAGTLWFTGQAGTLGRLNPSTGVVEAFDAPRGSGPYGIDATPDGEVWLASLAGSYLGRIDRATGGVEVIEPPTPGAGVRRVWADPQGRLWVSEWNAGQLGRYDPADGSWREWPLPGPRRPQAYAVYVDDEGVPWVTDFGNNAIVRFDPATEQLTQIPVPSDEAAVRQLLGRDGEVWGAESATDKLILIRTGA